MLRRLSALLVGFAILTSCPAFAETVSNDTVAAAAAAGQAAPAAPTEPQPAQAAAAPAQPPATQTQTQPAAATAPASADATDTTPASTPPAAAAPATTGAAPDAAKGAAEAEEAAAAPPPPPPPTLLVSIDLGQQRMVVSENGAAKYTWPISSGTAGYATPTGTFRPQWTAKMWYSRKYDWAPMPNAVFIHGGVAIHATQHTGALGRPASHGCIRLAPGHAKTFYNLVHRHGLKLTKVSVYGTPKFRGPAIASRKKRQRIYAQEPSYWGWGAAPAPSYYNGYSAYDPRFANRKYYRATKPPRGNNRVVRRGGNRYVYVNPPPSYYDNSW